MIPSGRAWSRGLLLFFSYACADIFDHFCYKLKDTSPEYSSIFLVSLKNMKRYRVQRHEWYHLDAHGPGDCFRFLVIHMLIFWSFLLQIMYVVYGFYSHHFAVKCLKFRISKFHGIWQENFSFSRKLYNINGTRVLSKMSLIFLRSSVLTCVPYLSRNS